MHYTSQNTNYVSSNSEQICKDLIRQLCGKISHFKEYTVLTQYSVPMEETFERIFYQLRNLCKVLMNIFCLPLPDADFCLQLHADADFYLQLPADTDADAGFWLQQNLDY